MFDRVPYLGISSLLKKPKARQAVLSCDTNIAIVVGVDYGREILTALPQTVPISVYVVSAKVSLLGLAKRYGSTPRLATSMHSVERTPVQNHICINVKHEAHG